MKIADDLRTPEGRAALAKLKALVAERSENPAIAEERKKCEESLAYFLQRAWRYIDPAEYNHNWHIDFIAAHAEAVATGDIRRLIVNQPPRTMKTILLSVAYPAWVWAQSTIGPQSGPQVKFMYASYGLQLSLDHSVACRNLILSPWYQRLWGNRFSLLDDQNTKGMFVNSKGGYRIATSVGGALTGRGADCIVVDDPHNTQDVVSDVDRESSIRWWSQSLSTRINDPKTGVFIVVMQRQHEDDLTGHLLSGDGEWVHVMLPMRYESNRSCNTLLGEDIREYEGQLLWPERFGEKETESLERELGPFGAAGQLQQRPQPEGGGIIKSEWWQLWPPAWMNQEGGVPLRYPSMSYIVASCDTAYTAKEENDYSACVVLGVWSNEKGQPKIMVMECWKDRLEFHDLVKRIINTCQKRRVDALLVESKASGLSIKQEIIRLVNNSDFTVHAINPGAQDKVARMHAVVPLFAGGCVYAPDRQWADDLIKEVSQFPKGKHDDCADALTQGLSYLRKLGLALLAPESDEQVAEAQMYHGAEDNEPLYPT